MSRNQHRVELSRVIPADRERVFEAWTRPEHLKRWSCPEGAEVEEAEVDLVVGGRYRICMRVSEDSTVTAQGVYRHIEPPHRLSYTWDWQEEPHRMGLETLVTVEFKDLGAATEVILRHEGFPDAENTDGHRVGWQSCLGRLVVTIEAEASHEQLRSSA